MQAGSPIHLTATTTVQSGSAGVGVNAAALRPPLGLPMEIHAIRFQLRIDSDFTSAYGNSIGCKLQIGEEPLTSGFVPIFLFGRGDADIYEYNSQRKSAFEHVMRLSRPLYIGPDQTIIPSFQHRGFFTQDIVVRIGLVGEIKNRGYRPSKVIYPYVSYYASKSFNAYGAADSDESTEKDLLNPFAMPLAVERFVGRTAIFGSSVIAKIDESNNLDFSARYLTMTMVDSDGNQIVRDNTIFANVFHTPIRTWETPHVLAGNRYYRVALAKSAPSIEDDTKLGQAFVSMVGSREIG